MQSGRWWCGLVSGPTGFRGTLPSQQGSPRRRRSRSAPGEDDIHLLVVYFADVKFEEQFMFLCLADGNKTRYAERPTQSLGTRSQAPSTRLWRARGVCF